MNAFLRKELRLLRPSFLIGIATALSIWLLPSDLGPRTFWSGLAMALPFVCCPAVAVMLALDSFGGEVNSRTFSQLLAQPISRGRIWWTKISLLAAALLLIWAVWFTSMWRVGLIAKGDLCDVLAASILYVFCAFSGGLWTVLFFRKVSIAFWITILTPAALLVTVGLLLSSHPLEAWADNHPGLVAGIFVTVCLLYSVTGFLFARRLFLRAQDVQWSGGDIALPGWRARFSLRIGAGSQRRFRPLATTLFREVQLHGSQIIIAAALTVLHLGAIAVRNLAHGLQPNGMVDFTLRHLWFLWLMMPLLTGCAAVAEERRLGTLESQLCLPAKRRTQFAVKLLVAIGLSLLFGAIMPVLLEALDGSAILPDASELFSNSNGSSFWGVLLFNTWFGHALVLIAPWLPVVLLTGIVLAIGAISFFFSTLSHNTLQSLGVSLLGILAVGFLCIAGLLPQEFVGYPLWRGFLAHVIGLLVLALAGVVFAYRNYQRVESGWSAWRRNLLALAAALAFITAASTALYHRVWELALPLEPEPSPARLATSQRVTLHSEPGSVAVELPDGRCWEGNLGSSLSGFMALMLSDWRIKELSGGSGFLEGTNWASVADCLFDIVGIRSDGTLWISQKGPRDHVSFPNQRRSPPVKLSAFTQVGTDRDWKSAVDCYQDTLLLKQDGTLWTWTWRADATNRNPNWPGLRASNLEQVGTDSDWAAIYRMADGICLRKTDGRVWSDLFYPSGKEGGVTVSHQRILGRATALDGHDWRGAAWVVSPPEVLVGVRDDGTFRLIAKRPSASYEYVKLDIQLGRETNWLAAAPSLGLRDVILLKTDGTLWRWTFPDDLQTYPFPGDPQTYLAAATATRLGRRSDWIAITRNGLGLMSLAADGSLWYWRAEPDYATLTRDLGIPPLIGVSRRPQKIANIFDAAR